MGREWGGRRGSGAAGKVEKPGPPPPTHPPPATPSLLCNGVLGLLMFGVPRNRPLWLCLGSGVIAGSSTNVLLPPVFTGGVGRLPRGVPACVRVGGGGGGGGDGRWCGCLASVCVCVCA